MKFSNFLFPESRDPTQDERVIDETLREKSTHGGAEVLVVTVELHGMVVVEKRLIHYPRDSIDRMP